MKFYFDTEPAWIEAVKAWAADTPRVTRVWIFGSRALGVRRRKLDAELLPDIDIAYELLDDAEDPAIAHAIWSKDKWIGRLQATIPVRIDLQYVNTADRDAVMPGYLRDGAVLIYITPTEQLARELWEAYATRNQAVIAFPTLHWDEVDDFTRDTWRMLARIALSFQPGVG